MQTKILSFLIVLFTTTTAVAQQPVNSISAEGSELAAKEASFTVAIMPEKVGTAFRLIVHNPEKKKIDVRINHRELGALVDTSFTDQQFNCRYNFDQVQDGNYQVILINGREKVVKDVEINTVVSRNVVIR